MKVTVDLDPKDVWRIQAAAEKRGVPAGVIVREELAARRTHLEFRDRVRSRVLAGMCDADIAADLNRPPGTIAQIRRGMGLKANQRYRKAAQAADEGKTA